MSGGVHPPESPNVSACGSRVPRVIVGFDAAPAPPASALATPPRCLAAAYAASSGTRSGTTRPAPELAVAAGSCETVTSPPFVTVNGDSVCGDATRAPARPPQAPVAPATRTTPIVPSASTSSFLARVNRQYVVSLPRFGRPTVSSGRPP